MDRMESSSGSDVEAGFAKLQGEDCEYYMQTYSIILGRNSKKSSVDVDLSSLGGGMNISRHHCRIFYDFHRRRFALQVLGKNGCFVQGVHHLPASRPVVLGSQDLLSIGDKDFYFLLPARSILAGKRGRGGGEYYHDDDESEDDDVGANAMVKRSRRLDGVQGTGFGYASGFLDKRTEGRSRPSRDADNQQLLQLEEKDVVTSVANILSDVCGPGEWMPMEKLHSELIERYGNVWHHSRVRRYLTSEDYESPEATTKPWYGLLMLLRKYPEHFVVNTRSKGQVTLEFVSLFSLIS